MVQPLWAFEEKPHKIEIIVSVAWALALSIAGGVGLGYVLSQGILAVVA